MYSCKFSTRRDTNLNASRYINHLPPLKFSLIPETCFISLHAKFASMLRNKKEKQRTSQMQHFMYDIWDVFLMKAIPRLLYKKKKNKDFDSMLLVKETCNRKIANKIRGFSLDKRNIRKWQVWRLSCKVIQNAGEYSNISIIRLLTNLISRSIK